jgi:hypothetical protein
VTTDRPFRAIHLLPAAAFVAYQIVRLVEALYAVQ